MDSLTLGEGESLFARFLPDGALAVANGPRIVILNPDGTFGRILARDGDGPGEFRVVTSLGVSTSGSLFASDHLSARFTEMSPSGEVLRFIARLESISGDMGTYPFAELADGHIVAAPWQARAARRVTSAVDPGALIRDDVPVVSYDSAGDITDTLLQLPGIERVNGFVAPFSRSALFAGRGERWVAGVSDSLDLMVFEGTRPIIRLSARPTTESPSTEDRRRRDSLILGQFGTETGVAVLERQAAMPATNVLPDIGGVAIDDRGAIWVGDYATPGSVERGWFVFDIGGACLGRLTLPAYGTPLLPTRTELLDVAYGRVALIRESDDGEIYIEVREIAHEPAQTPRRAIGCTRAATR